MICCDRCLEWYHSTCDSVNVPACMRVLGVETRHGLALRAAVTQCNCTSLMITVTTSFSVMIMSYSIHSFIIDRFGGPYPLR